ncbi:MAG: enoyl-CoA hydratase [Rhodospirillaceae bacterium]|nr:enoyl-CoA hydratase [Rhodospirillaceae bacterium]
MDSAVVAWTKENKVAVVTIMNPPVNVLTIKVRDGLKRCFQDIEQDREVSAVVITGNGEKAFMAGADIKSFPDMFGIPGAAYGFARTVYEVWDYIENFPKPTIAAINGLAFGAGLELALACDIRIASENAKFGLPEINLGLFPGGGGTQRMPRLAGSALAKEMIFTGEHIDCGRALASGFLNQVVPRGEALSRAKEIAGRIASHSQVILRLAKAAVNRGADVSLREAISVEAELWQDAFMTEDIKEGVTAFIEKRTPRFDGR